MSLDATETYHILLRSWCQARQPPAIGSRIGQLVVEESAIELGDWQQPLSTVTSWKHIARGSSLYHCKAAIVANNLLQSDPESVRQLWRNVPSSSRIARILIRKLSPGLAISWVLMPQSHALYSCIAGIEGNSFWQLAPESAKRLWRNLLWNSGIAKVHW